MSLCQVRLSLDDLTSFQQSASWSSDLQDSSKDRASRSGLVGLGVRARVVRLRLEEGIAIVGENWGWQVAGETTWRCSKPEESSTYFVVG